MKKTITIIVILVALGAVAYGISATRKKAVAMDPCGVDFTSTFVNDAPLSMTETEVATTILTQYLEALKKVTGCPAYLITDYKIVSVGNIKEVKGDFTAEVKFDILPFDMAQNTLKTPESIVEGDWIRGKQARLGIIRYPGQATSTVSYRLAI